VDTGTELKDAVMAGVAQRKRQSVSVPTATQLMTVAEVCEVLRLHKSSIRRMMKSGQLIPIKLGSDSRAPLRFSLASVVSLIERFANGTAE
jgi:excisionase family DNA binding protein